MKQELESSESKCKAQGEKLMQLDLSAKDKSRTIDELKEKMKRAEKELRSATRDRAKSIDKKDELRQQSTE